MDQIYIPKNRAFLPAGSYVLVTAINQTIKKTKEKKLVFYNAGEIESIKLEIIQKTIMLINKFYPNRENLIITGSFLNKGFNFNDLDIIIITSMQSDKVQAEKEIKKRMGISVEINILTHRELNEGLNSDPFYRVLLSKCISEKKLIFRTKNEYNYKFLDLHLLKSKTLIDNFGHLNGKEKYKLTRNMITIKMFLENKKVSYLSLEKEIISLFKLKNIEEIKDNLLNKKAFLKTYKSIYSKTFDKIIRSIKNDTKQKSIN